MIDLIIKWFFSKGNCDKKNNITILKNRELKREVQIFDRGNEIKMTDERTCLSKYFKNIKGLNVEERLRSRYIR
jgi:hypothetical protein